MDREVVKAKVVAFFRSTIQGQSATSQPRQSIQLNSLHRLFSKELEGVPEFRQTEVYSLVHEIVHEFVTAGFLYPGMPSSSHLESGYPWLTITTYGRGAFMAEDWLPYDPEGYLAALNKKVPNLDPVTGSYIGEAVATFNRRHLLSSTITLGVASENLMLRLIEAYAAWLPAPDQDRFGKRIADKGIYVQFKEFKTQFESRKGAIPRDICSDWETYLDGIFNFIRINRNSAGHPTGTALDAKVVYANLQIFADYASYIARLIDFLTQ